MRRLEFVTIIPSSIQNSWNFFSSPENLEKITPKEMNFRITSPLPERMYPGMLISYRVSPLSWMRVNWLTEITHVSEYIYFVDEQRIGPYRIWHHEHHFRETEGGVEMKDILTYRLPMGILGKLIDYLIVNRTVNSIFAYRETRIRELFFN